MIIDSARYIIPGTSYGTVLDGKDSTTESVPLGVVIFSGNHSILV